MAASVNQPTSNTVLNLPSKPVKVAEIERELGILWGNFSQEHYSGHPVMRACMSNLIIYCDNAEQAGVIGNEISAIVDVHPARVLLLVGDGQFQASGIEAYVSIYYTPLEDSWQICGERIDVVASADIAERLPSVARAQLIGDLPTTLWWASRQPPPEVGNVFFQLAGLANQIIYDNMGWLNPVKGVATMSRWVAAQQDEQIVYNLAWRRVAIWRKLIAQTLDPKINPGKLEALSSIEINHGPHALPMTWLLVGWLTSQLKWQSVDGKRLSNSELIWKFHNGRHEIKIIVKRLPQGEPLLYKLLLSCNTGSSQQQLCFERIGDDRIAINELNIENPALIFAAQIPERADLVAAQLAHRNRDKTFENALKAANTIASTFQW